MGKLNIANPHRTRGVIVSNPTVAGLTRNGAPGYNRDAKSELFLLAVTNFVGEKTFYEDATKRDTRFETLVAQAAMLDPQWTAEFLGWLRHGANMRTAAIVGAVVAGRTIAALPYYPRYLAAGNPSPRSILDSVLLRADEPGDALAYALNTDPRWKLPKWFKRGLGDAALRLYTPYNFLKWDSPNNAVRFADVIELTQIARNRVPHERSTLFKYILDDRHGRGGKERLGELPEGEVRQMLVSRWRFNQIPQAKRRQALSTPQFPTVLRQAGLTWEAISGWVGGPMDAAVWEAAIPQMGYGALIRNLRNFEQAQISPAVRRQVIARLTDPTQVVKSRLLPMAFLNAYNNVASDHYKAALDEAATHALRWMPVYPGRTLVLIDTSSSMADPFSTHRGRPNPDAEKLFRWDVAALFGIAFARVCEQADVVSFSDSYGLGRGFYTWQRQYQPPKPGTKQFPLKAGENLLAAVQRFRKDYFLGGGTATKAAIDAHFKGHDRVLILTDEQADAHGAQDVFARVPASVPSYTFNLAGYAAGHAPSTGNRHTVGGLSDAGFRMIQTLEQFRQGRWPWQEAVTADDAAR